MGKYVDRFEEEFAAFCGRRHGIAGSNGTAALHLALAALEKIGAPYGNRTRVFAVRGRRPGPLDEGSWAVGCLSIAIAASHFKAKRAKNSLPAD